MLRRNFGDLNRGIRTMIDKKLKRLPHIVLLAEDDDEMRALLAQALRKCGYDVTECEDGMELLLRLNPLLESNGEVEYDVIISDIYMPGLSGMEVMESLARKLRCPPIILITAFGDHEIHEKAKRLGVAAILDKPFEIEDLLTAVRAALGESSNCTET